MTQLTIIRGCNAAGCDKPHKAKGYCKAHYKRWKRHGDPLAGGTPTGAPLAFLENIVIPFDGDECLIWPFTTGRDGYGRISLHGKMYLVSRVVCEREHGPPPTPKHEAAHLCGKGRIGCVNRKHLEWKTRKENEADKLAHGTRSRGEQSCFAKLTEAQVLEIRYSTKPQSQLATKYGIAQSTVSQIKARKRWAWLEDAA